MSPQKNVIKPLSGIPESKTVFFQKDEDEYTDDAWDELNKKDYEQDIELRKKYARKIHKLVKLYLIILAIIVMISGVKTEYYTLDSSVVMSLIGASAVHIIGLLALVLRDLFRRTSE